MCITNGEIKEQDKGAHCKHRSEVGGWRTLLWDVTSALLAKNYFSNKVCSSRGGPESELVFRFHGKVAQGQESLLVLTAGTWGFHCTQLSAVASGLIYR